MALPMKINQTQTQTLGWAPQISSEWEWLFSLECRKCMFSRGWQEKQIPPWAPPVSLQREFKWKKAWLISLSVQERKAPTLATFTMICLWHTSALHHSSRGSISLGRLWSKWGKAGCLPIIHKAKQVQKEASASLSRHQQQVGRPGAQAKLYQCRKGSFHSSLSGISKLDVCACASSNNSHICDS